MWFLGIGFCLVSTFAEMHCTKQHISDAIVRIVLVMRLSLSSIHLVRSDTNNSPSAPLNLGPVKPAITTVVVEAAELFGESNEVRIRHQGQEYRLRITRSGKLILTK